MRAIFRIYYPIGGNCTIPRMFYFTLYGVEDADGNEVDFSPLYIEARERGYRIEEVAICKR